MATEVLELQLRVSGGDVGAAQFGKLTQAATGATNALRFLRNALVLASSVRLASGVFEIVDAYQRMQNQLLAVLGSQALANTAFNDLYRISQATRTPLDATVTLFSRMARAGAALHINLGDVEKAVTAVNESFIINASTANESRNAVLQLSHELASGQVRGRSLLSVIQSGPAIAQAFADEMYKLGLTTDKYGNKVQLAGSALYNFIKEHQGLLTGRIAFQALVDGAEKIQEQFDRTNPTIGTLYTQIKNAFTYISGTLLNASGLLTGFNNLLGSVRDHMGEILATVGAIGLAFGSWLVIDIITAQFAKLFAFQGIFRFLLSPLINLITAFVNLGVFIGEVVTGLSIMGAVMVGVIQFIFGLLNGVVQMGQGLIALVSAFYSTVYSAAEFVSSLADVEQAVVKTGTSLVVVGDNALQVGSNFASAASSVVASGVSIGAALFAGVITALSSIVILLPVLLTATTAVTAVFGGLVSLGEGLLGIPRALDAAAQKTASWHDILNSFISFALTAFDVLANHFPLVVAAISSVWHDMIADFAIGLEHVYNAIDIFLVQPFLKVAQIIAGLLPLLGVLSGAGIGARLGALAGPEGAAIGGLAGAIVGGAAGAFGGVKFEDWVSQQRQSWADMGVQVETFAVDAAKQAAHSYTNELSSVIAADMKKYGQEDFGKAFNLLTKGVPLDQIAKQTGVSIGDLRRVNDLKHTFLPSPGVVPDEFAKVKRDPLAEMADRDRVALDQLAQGVSPYAKYIDDVDKATQVFNKIKEDNKLLAAAGRQQLNVGQQLARLGLTQTDVLNRQTRALIDVGNKTTDYNDKVRLLDDSLKKHIITLDEYTDAKLRAAITANEAVKGSGPGARAAGATAGLDSAKLALFNEAPISKEAIAQAVSGEQALAKYAAQYKSLHEAIGHGITQDQAEDQIRKDAIIALGQQTDATSGYESALLKFQQTAANVGADVEKTFTTAFEDINASLTTLLSTGKLSLGKFFTDIRDNVAGTAAHQILNPILDGLIKQGGFLGQIGNGLAGTLNPADGSQTNPFWVRLWDQANGLGAGLLGGNQSGGGPLGSFFSNLISGNGGGIGSASSSILNFLGLGNSALAVQSSGSLAALSSNAAVSSTVDSLSSSGFFQLPGFATGGSFDVGGSGATDSQLVAFRATPGEHVSVGQDSGGYGNVIINDMRTSSDSQPVSTKVSNVNGKKQLEIFIADTVNKNIAAGTHDQAMATTFGLARAGKAR